MKTLIPSKLLKVERIHGKTLTLRDASIDDAEFILSLRVDPEKSRYLSAVSKALEDQRAWLQYYAYANDQAYFIIESKREPIGTVRLYDAKGDSFSWGSWILTNRCPKHAAMESALIVYAYALDYLGFQTAHFNVRKGNKRVWLFHERFGASRVRETELDYFYEISRGAIDQSRDRYKKFLSGTVILKQQT